MNNCSIPPFMEFWISTGSMCFLAFTANPSTAATTVTAAPFVDWLELSSEELDLVDDSGQPAAKLQIDVARGTVLESGLSGVLGAEFWDSFPDIYPSAEAMDVPTTSLRVTPDLEGTAEYRVTLNGNLDSSVIALGGLFADSGSGLGDVTISGFTNSSSVSSPVEFLGTFDWNNGVSNFDSELTWQPETFLLAPASGTSGESGFAFFRVNDGLDRLDFDFRYTNFGFPGDSASLAVGIVIPEPSYPFLILGSLSVVLLRRRRSNGC